ncbi:MAG: hypothetical protein K6F74_01420 [Prevotella sp.]|nr:hypothetical protein [Prevotella sp.]
MKEIVLKIDDNAFDDFLGMIRHCPFIEVLSTSQDIDSREVRDKCFYEAVLELQRDRLLRTRSDYTYIMLAVNDRVVDGFYFYSPLDYLDYMSQLGLEHLPGKSVLYDTVKKVGKHYPNWSFSDKPDANERLRRNNIVIRFISAFNRAKRRLSERIPENKP